MGIDAFAPVENPKLKELLNKRANAEQQDKLMYLNQIADEVAHNARLIVIIEINNANIQSNSDGTATIPKGADISFPGINLKDGRFLQPLFTDWDELRKWEPFKDCDVSTVIMSFEDIYTLVSRDRGTVVINPFGDAVVFPFDMLARIKEVKEAQNIQVSQQVVQQDTKVTLGEPKEYPRQMVDAIIEYAKGEGAISALWLQLMKKDGEDSFLIVVDAEEDPRSYFQNIAQAAVPHLPKGMFIDMVPATSNFGRGIAEEVEPFYRK